MFPSRKQVHVLLEEVQSLELGHGEQDVNCSVVFYLTTGSAATHISVHSAS